MTSSHARALSGLLALAFLAACAGGDAPPAPVDDASAVPPPSAETIARREAYRDELRARLGDAYDEPLGVEFDPDRLRRGAKLYGQLCAACHGEYGRGDGATAGALAQRPADLSDPEFPRLYSERATLEILREGVPGTPMLGWGEALPEEDLINLTLYVRSLSRAVGNAR